MSKIKLSKEFIKSTVKLALNEDLYPSGDITSSLINNDKVGIIIDFKDYDIKSLTYKITNYLNDDSHKVRCRLIGEKYFSLSNAVKNLDEIYNSLCKKIYQ